MNVGEAIHTQTLLAWLTNPPTDSAADPDGADVEGMAVTAARFLADRARTALGAGPDADQIGDALRARLTADPTRRES